MQKLVQKLTKENDKLRREVISQRQQIEMLRRNLVIKDLLLKESDRLKNDGREVLEKIKAEVDQFGKRITKQLNKLKKVEPPIDTVGIYHAESLDSVMPKSPSEYSENKGSESSTHDNIKYNEDEDSDRENDHGSSIQSDKTIINRHHLLSSVAGIAGTLPKDDTYLDTLTDQADKERSKRYGMVWLSEESIVSGPNESSKELSDTTETQLNSTRRYTKDTRSVSFVQPTQVQSPSDSDLSDSKPVKPRHTKEMAVSPLSKTIVHTQQPTGESEFISKFKQITGKR